MIQELLGQTNFAGRDGFYWWMGQVETEKGSQAKPNDDRYKVRIVGQHLKDCNAVSHDDLPWAIVMMPATAPRREGNTDFQSVKYKSGDWVIGFFLDGREGQQPVILGSIGQQTSSTKDVGKGKPASACLAFTTFLDPDTNTNTGVAQDKKNAVQNNGVDGTKGGANPSGTPVDLRSSVNASNETASTALLGTKCCNNALNPGGEYFCVEISDAKCEDGDSGQTKLEFALSELFAAVSSSGGSAGDSLVSKYTGKLYDYIGIAQGYIGKVSRIASSIVARVKGELFTYIKSGAKEILNFLLTTEVIDPTQPGTFVGPYANSTEAVKPAKKRVGRLRSITKWINDQLKNVNCVMEDLDARLSAFLEELIFGYLEQIINSAKCLIDSIVQDILNKIASFLDEIINLVLGPLQQLLSIIANPLNILGAALKQIFDLLGISCGGGENACVSKEQKSNCSGNCGEAAKDDDFLDGLIAGIENGNLDSGSGTCSDSYSVPETPATSIEIIGGVPDENAYTGSQPAVIPPTDTLDDIIDNALFPPTDGGAGGTGGGTGGDGGTGDNTTIITPPNVTPDLNPPKNTPPTNIIPSIVNDVNLDYVSSSNLSISGAANTVEFFDNNGATPSITFKEINVISNNSTIISSNNIFEYVPIDITPESITYNLSVNKTRVSEGETIKFTLVANGGVVPNGTVFNYVLFGTITRDDFLDQTTIGTMEMYNNIAEKTIGIAEDSLIETDELVTFNVLEAAVAVPFTIVGSGTSTSTTPSTVPVFISPKIGTPEVCDDGRVMYIPILETGDKYKVPPIVRIRGAGFGASAVAELNAEGYLSNIKITRSGTGYKPTRVNTNCYISNFAIINPGIGYYTEPTVYIDGDSSIAKAKIDDRGFVTTIELVNKTKIFVCTPRVEITSGNGLGAKALPLMECRTDELYKEYVAKVAPSGVDEVIDCP
jgi:hypothetical protein